MRAHFTTGRIGRRQRRLVRAVAVFFLLFTAADITLPQYFCGGEEVGGIPLRQVTRVATEDAAPDSTLLASLNSEDSLPSHDGEQAPHEEDCFCCCAHVLASVGMHCAGCTPAASPSVDLAAGRLPDAPTSSTYHPPRLA